MSNIAGPKDIKAKRFKLYNKAIKVNFGKRINIQISKYPIAKFDNIQSSNTFYLFLKIFTV